MNDVGERAIYRRLLQPVRAAGTTVPGRSLEEEADSDRGRVLFSAPFRRLQNKAQVFSLESNAAVRSRLSHSLEVSSVGRYVAQQVLKGFAERGSTEKLGLAGHERPFISFVETACLLHDIGNPPFGHFGELAIGDWFRKHADTIRQSSSIARMSEASKQDWSTHYSDLVNFDGNAQGFRVITRLQQERRKAPGENFGANLTLTQLAAMIKYPRTSAAANAEPGREKGGYFVTEADVVDLIRKTLGMADGGRHPLVYLMESADDIAYCLSDLEDGIEKGLVDPVELAASVRSVLGKVEPPTDEEERREFQSVLDALDNILEPATRVRLYEVFWDLRSSTIRLLVKRAARCFVVSHSQVIDSTLPGLLRAGEPEKTLLGSLKDYAQTRLYSSSIVRRREITGHRVLHGLLDAYLPLLLCEKERFHSVLSGEPADTHDARITVEGSLASLFPAKYVEVYYDSLATTHGFRTQPDVREWSLRAHLIVDYISGMTDDFALRTYQMVSGMRV